MRALRKFEASVSADVGTPGGSGSTRFSTCPSSATSTTSARSGSSRTNSMCLRREFNFGVSTTAGGARQPRQMRQRLADRLLDRGRTPGRGELHFDGAPLLFGEIADFHQRIDEEAKPELGRQTAGRGVRCVDQAELLEILHDVAHRRRRQRYRNDARDVARADRLAGREIVFDDLPENLARALVDLRKPAGCGDAEIARAWVVIGHDSPCAHDLIRKSVPTFRDHACRNVPSLRAIQALNRPRRWTRPLRPLKRRRPSPN